MRIVIPKSKSILTQGGLGNFISIDPGLGGTGYAIWSRERANVLETPIVSSSIEAPSEGPIEMRMNWLCVALRKVCSDHKVVEVVIEQPQFMEGGKGLVAARDGDLVKLSILTGALIGQMWRWENGNDVAASYGTHLVPVNQWKGNMSKELTDARVKQRLPKWRNGSGTSHESDAVGIGLYAKGMF